MLFQQCIVDTVVR